MYFEAALEICYAEQVVLESAVVSRGVGTGMRFAVKIYGCMFGAMRVM